MKKKIIATGLALSMLFLTACGSQAQEQTAETASETVEAEVVETEEEETNPLVEEGLDYFYARNEQEADYEKALELFTQAADAGSAEGYYYLGCTYLTPAYLGTVNANYKKSTEAFEKAYDLGYSPAGVKLGQTFEYGYGAKADYAKAKEYYDKALADGCVEANFGLGSLSYDGKGVAKDKAAAKDYFLLAAGSQDPAWAADAYDRLAKIEEYGDSYMNGMVYDYDNEDGRTVDYEKVIEYLTKANDLCTWNGDYLALLQSAYTRSGDANNAKSYQDAFEAWCEEAESLSNVRYLCDAGDMYNSQAYVGYDEEKGFAYYLKAAEFGDNYAMNMIGQFYGSGVGVTPDWDSALEWFEAAADNGSATAMSNIGYMYQHGLAVDTNYYTALEWYEKAAEAGSVTAMNQVAYLHQWFDDCTSAVAWYEAAIKNGNRTALANLGYMYLYGVEVEDKGNGLEPDVEKGAELIQEAADLGDIAGMRLLGECYANGLGVGQDFDTALEWSEKALTLAERQHNAAEIERLQMQIAAIQSGNMVGEAVDSAAAAESASDNGNQANTDTGSSVEVPVQQISVDENPDEYYDGGTNDALGSDD